MERFEFKIGDTVFLRTDSEQSERIVTGITIRATGTLFGLTQAATESWHYNFEITANKDITKL